MTIFKGMFKTIEIDIKIFPFCACCYHVAMANKLMYGLYGPTNQNSIKVPKENFLNKTLGTIVIKSPMSPSSLSFSIRILKVSLRVIGSIFLF